MRSSESRALIPLLVSPVFLSPSPGDQLSEQSDAFSVRQSQMHFVISDAQSAWFRGKVNQKRLSQQE